MATYADFMRNSTEFCISTPFADSELERVLRLANTVAYYNLKGYYEVIKDKVNDDNKIRYVSGLEEIINKDNTLKEGFVKVTIHINVNSDNTGNKSENFNYNISFYALKEVKDNVDKKLRSEYEKLKKEKNLYDENINFDVIKYFKILESKTFNKLVSVKEGFSHFNNKTFEDKIKDHYSVIAERILDMNKVLVKLSNAYDSSFKKKVTISK